MIPRYPFQLEEVAYLASHYHWALKVRRTMNFECSDEDLDDRVRREESLTFWWYQRGKNK